jgi:hypothetical protein
MNDETMSTTQLDAERLAAALDTVSDRDAQRYAVRLRFALIRLEDLQRDARERGGVFAQARVDIAQEILETHVRTASEFVARTFIAKRRAPTRRGAREAAAEALAALEEQRRAA